MQRLKLLLQPMRLPFLILAPACVSVGVGTAYWETGQIGSWNVLLVFLGGLSAHISVNVFNEYYDFKTGLDQKTQPTPFSGGSGMLPAHPEMEKETLLLGWLMFMITGAIGLYFVFVQGWQLVLVGVLGMVLLVTYTIFWVYQPVLSLLAPGIGFGLMMVMGTHFALTGVYSWEAFIASLVPTFLVSDLLLLNQFPDVEADRSIGRRHFPILVGRESSAVIYGIFLLLTYLAVVVGVILQLLPVLSLITLTTSILGWKTFRSVQRHAGEISELVPVLGMNVILSISTPALLSLSLFLA
ncbi:MAG: prenyltransferase [Anaerolineales bacterium]|nr:prenyltransferase [Anaerolineales bacterium]